MNVCNNIKILPIPLGLHLMVFNLSQDFIINLKFAQLQHFLSRTLFAILSFPA